MLRQRFQGGTLALLENLTTACAAGHRGIVEPVKLAADGRVHCLEREEGLVAQRQQDVSLLAVEYSRKTATFAREENRHRDTVLASSRVGSDRTKGRPRQPLDQQPDDAPFRSDPDRNHGSRGRHRHRKRISNETGFGFKCFRIHFQVRPDSANVVSDLARVIRQQLFANILVSCLYGRLDEPRVASRHQ